MVTVSRWPTMGRPAIAVMNGFQSGILEKSVKTVQTFAAGGIDIDFGLDWALGHLNARCYGTMTGILQRNALKLHAGLALTSSLAISALPR
jgi:hypothetical protein